MKDKITAKLTALGQEIDDTLLTFIIGTVEQEILDFINREIMPDTLENVIINVVTGRYLSQLDAYGKIEGINFDKTIKALTEGDLSITYDDGISAEIIFKNYIQTMGQLPKGQLIRYRRIAW